MIIAKNDNQIIKGMQNQISRLRFRQMKTFSMGPGAQTWFSCMIVQSVDFGVGDLLYSMS